ncbi:MAG: hypothetical protein N2109_06520 [Fimbriimonadales bacterium]|nr:hypothetical protein [Fimbriimonadales bacterium]
MTRAAAALALLAAAAASPAQLAAARAVQDAARQGAGGNPMQASGFPPDAPRDGALPQASPSGLKAFRVLRAGSVSRSGDRVRLTDGAAFAYEGYEGYAEEIEGDLATKLFELRGAARLVGADGIVRAESLRIDFERRRFWATESASQLSPDLLKGRVLADLYVEGRSTAGTEGHIHTEDGSLTTCSLERPHFDLTANRIDVFPARRAILRSVDLRLFERSLARIPYVSLPLREDADRYLPDVGQSSDEGYYVKTRFGVGLPREDSFDARFDYYSKLGPGLGADYDYKTAQTDGRLRVFGLVGDNPTLEFASRHRQRLPFGQLALDNTLQRRNYLDAPDTTTLLSRAALDFDRRDGSTRLTLNRTNTEQGEFEYAQQTIQFADTRRFGSRSNQSLDLAWVTSRSATTTRLTERERIDVRYRYREELRAGSAELEYTRSIPVGENAGFFNSTDRTPLLTFRSDTARLMGQRVGSAIPATLQLSLGEFRDPVTKGSLQRTSLELNSSRNSRLAKGWSLSTDARFVQGVYSDDTAQYATGLGSVLRWDYGAQSSVNLRYSFLEWHGYTPLQLDRLARSNFLSLDWSARPVRSWTLGLQTGYDFGRAEDLGDSSRWQTVGFRSEWRPKGWFQLRALANYDTSRESLGTIRLDALWKPGATTVALGARYDGFRDRWAAANLFVDGLKYGRLKLSAVLAYNGYLRQFEAAHYSFTYDLHCAEAILQVLDNNVGFRSGRQVFFFIRLKAFPFDTPFGTGTRGQAIGTGTGGYSF